MRLEDREVLHSADARYSRSPLEDLRLLQLVYDKDEMRASLLSLRILQARGERLLFNDDLDFWGDNSGAPVDYEALA